MAYGVDSEINERVDMYSSDPQKLMQRYGQSQSLLDLLALQKLKSEKEAAMRNMQAQMQPRMDTVKDQREQQVLDMTRNEVAQQAMQGGQQLALNRQRAMQARGLPTQQAPNMGGMMGGGIVGYQAGGEVEDKGMLEKIGRTFLGDESYDIIRQAIKGNKANTQMQPPMTESERVTQLQNLILKRKAAGATDAEIQRIQEEINSYDLGGVKSGGLKGFESGGVVNYQAGGAVNIDALLDSLMMAESGGNPRAVSSAGAEGAYQIMPSTAADPGFGVSPMQGDRFDPEASRKFAKQYLQAMIDRYDGDMEAALVAYNAGPGNADKFVAAGKNYDVLPQAMQTKPYVERVMGQISPQQSYERVPEGGLSALAVDPVKPRRFEAPAPVAVRDTSEDVASMLERIDPAAAPKEADMMRTVSRRDAEKQRAVNYLQGIGRAQDSRRDREAAGGLSYIKALADAEAAQKANALRYLQQAGKFQKMQGDTENMLAALDPAAEGVKGFSGTDGSFVEARNPNIGRAYLDPETGEPMGLVDRIARLIQGPLGETYEDPNKMTPEEVTAAGREARKSVYERIADPNFVPMTPRELEADPRSVRETPAVETPAVDPRLTQEMYMVPRTIDEATAEPTGDGLAGLAAAMQPSRLEELRKQREDVMGGITSPERLRRDKLRAYLSGLGQTGLGGGAAALTKEQQRQDALRVGDLDKLIALEREDVKLQREIDASMAEVVANNEADLSQIMVKAGLEEQMNRAGDRRKFIADVLKQLKDDLSFQQTMGTLNQQLREGDITAGDFTRAQLAAIEQATQALGVQYDVDTLGGSVDFTSGSFE